MVPVLVLISLGSHSNYTHPTETPQAYCFWQDTNSILLLADSCCSPSHLPVEQHMPRPRPDRLKQHEQREGASQSILPAEQDN